MISTGASWSGDISGSVTQSYNNNFWTTSRSVNGNVINYGYDKDGLLTQAGGLTIGREVQQGGLINGTTLGTLTTSRGYNDFGELQNYTASYGASSLYSNTYTHDKLGRIKTQAETIQGDLSPVIRTKPQMRFPVILTKRRPQHEKTLYRRTDN